MCGGTPWSPGILRACWECLPRDGGRVISAPCRVGLRFGSCDVALLRLVSLALPAYSCIRFPLTESRSRPSCCSHARGFAPSRQGCSGFALAPCFRLRHGSGFALARRIPACRFIPVAGLGPLPVGERPGRAGWKREVSREKWSRSVCNGRTFASGADAPSPRIAARGYVLSWKERWRGEPVKPHG